MTKPYEQMEQEAQLSKMPDLTKWGEGIEGCPKGYPLGLDDLPENGKFNVKLNEDWQIIGARTKFNDEKDAWQFAWQFQNVTVDSQAKGQIAELFFWFPMDGIEDNGMRIGDASKIGDILIKELELFDKEKLRACESWDEIFQLYHDHWAQTLNRTLTGPLNVSAYKHKRSGEFKGPFINLGFLKRAAADEVPF